MSNLQPKPRPGHAREGEQGFLLLGVIVMIALVLIVLSVAAPIVAKDLRREKELEAVHRGQQYVRAIRIYHLKTNAYPANVKQLEKTNNERFLRQHYLDPLTGKDDWKLIGVGQAKTTVKGFFGQPLAGLATSGLGSASGLSSGVGAGVNTGGAAGGGVLGAGSTTGTGAGAAGTGTGAGTGTATTGDPGGGSSFGSSSFGSSSFGQGGQSGQSGTGGSPLDGGSVGPFLGVGIPKDGNSIITLNEQTTYATWEFIYDPRIEPLYAKSSIFGGGIATQSGGLGSASGLSSTTGGGLGSPTGGGFGSPTTPASGASGAAGPTDPGTTPPTAPNPNPGTTQNPQ